MEEQQRTPGGELLERTRTAVRTPTLFKVILHNDDYTTMAFVVEVLETIFLKQPVEAYSLMMKVHVEGQAICGLYPYEIAETKVGAVHVCARDHAFPLRASLEPD
jgi:ATP-dependent Clp protease adaptor protein ClpS